MEIKIDSVISCEFVEENKSIIFNLKDNFFSSYGLIKVITDFFQIENENIFNIREQINKEFELLKNKIKKEDYPLTIVVSIQNSKVLVERK